MFLQTDKVLNIESSLPFKKYGCAFMDIAYLSNQITKKTKDQYDIIAIAQSAINQNYLGKDLTIIDWENVFLLFGVKVKYYGHCDKKTNCKDNEIEILKLVKPNYSHFVCGDGSGNKTYDSLGIRPQSRKYKLENKRIFKIL